MAASPDRRRGESTLRPRRRTHPHRGSDHALLSSCHAGPSACRRATPPVGTLRHRPSRTASTLGRGDARAGDTSSAVEATSRSCSRASPANWRCCGSGHSEPHRAATPCSWRFAFACTGSGLAAHGAKSVSVERYSAGAAVLQHQRRSRQVMFMVALVRPPRSRRRRGAGSRVVVAYCFGARDRGRRCPPYVATRARARRRMTRGPAAPTPRPTPPASSRAGGHRTSASAGAHAAASLNDLKRHPQLPSPSRNSSRVRCAAADTNDDGEANEGSIDVRSASAGWPSWSPSSSEARQDVLLLRVRAAQGIGAIDGKARAQPDHANDQPGSRK